MFSAFADAGLQPQFIMKQINIPKKSQKRKAEDDAPSATHGKVDAKEEVNVQLLHSHSTNR